MFTFLYELAIKAGGSAEAEESAAGGGGGEERCAISSRQNIECPRLCAHMWEARGPGCQ